LSEQVQSDYPVSEALQAVYAVATLNDALALRGSFSAGESAITADGVWVGRHWLRLPKSGDDKSGVLGREQEIKALQQSIEEREADVERLNGELEELRNSQTSFEQRREMLQQAANDTNRQLVENRGNLQNMQRKVEDQRVRGEQLRTDKADIENRIAEANQSINSSRNQLETAINEMAKFERQRGELLAQRDQCRTTLEEIRITHRTARDEVHQIALQLETARTARKSVTENLSRTENQLQQLLQRREQVNEVLAQGDRPISELAQQLEEKLQLRMTVEQELAAARSGVEGLDEEIRNVEMQRNTLEQLTQERRAELDNCRLAWQELKVRRETVSEQLVETGHDPELVLREIDESAMESTWQEKSDQLAQRIQRLGAINLAAIDEFAEQSQRKEYLDRQNADLVESLETLESAIQKIDRETRTRFKETFDKVNNSFQTAFPRLFGGGHAYLQFTDNDLLETGVAVMARPPGKRNTTIHLLSGGEKALTAVALVFAIFQLNPAPFCMLDEVDAPLDEANVGRFCTMVKEMSEKVQFVFITHNKTTMEMSRQLMGVTMHEPGVSRLVAVDVDEALELAATG
jgi:chromosome segregation protein